MGVEATYMASDHHGSVDDSGFRSGMVRRRTKSKSDESPSWHWTGHICLGPLPGHCRCVGTQEREGKDEEKDTVEIDGEESGSGLVRH